MTKGYGYHKRLSERECRSKLDGFLKIVGKDYGYLWEGNPSLIEKYGAQDVDEFEVDFGKRISLGDAFPGKFDSLGIVKSNSMFYYYLEAYFKEGGSLITNSQTAYSRLKEQFDIQTEAFFNGLAKSIEGEINRIWERELEEKLSLLSRKLDQN